MFRFFGGAPRLLVPDNLKSGVNKASFYDPEINRSYGAMAAHYGVGILPARPQAARQGESGGRRAVCPDLYSRAACASRPSSRWPNATRPSPLAMQRMNERPCAGLASAAASCSRQIERAALQQLPDED